MMRLVAGHRRGASSDFGGLFAGWESPDCLVPRAVSRKALWYETPSETAILCHSFYGLASASKSRKPEFGHALRLRTARLAQNGTQAQNCHSACHWLRRTTASAELGHFDDRLSVPFAGWALPAVSEGRGPRRWAASADYGCPSIAGVKRHRRHIDGTPVHARSPCHLCHLCHLCAAYGVGQRRCECAFQRRGPTPHRALSNGRSDLGPQNSLFGHFFVGVPTRFFTCRNSFIGLAFRDRHPLKQCQIVPNSAISAASYASDLLLVGIPAVSEGRWGVVRGLDAVQACQAESGRRLLPYSCRAPPSTAARYDARAWYTRRLERAIQMNRPWANPRWPNTFS